MDKDSKFQVHQGGKNSEAAQNLRSNPKIANVIEILLKRTTDMYPKIAAEIERDGVDYEKIFAGSAELVRYKGWKHALEYLTGSMEAPPTNEDFRDSRHTQADPGTPPRILLDLGVMLAKDSDVIHDSEIDLNPEKYAEKTIKDPIKLQQYKAVVAAYYALLPLKKGFRRKN